MTPDQHLTYALATALAFTSRLVERHPKHAEIVAEVATILGAAGETGSGGGVEGMVDDNDRVTLHQAAIITATVEAWTPLAIPHLEQARNILEWAAAQPHSDRAPLFVNSKATEGAILTPSCRRGLPAFSRCDTSPGTSALSPPDLSPSRGHFFDSRSRNLAAPGSLPGSPPNADGSRLYGTITPSHLSRSAREDSPPLRLWPARISPAPGHPHLGPRGLFFHPANEMQSRESKG